MTQPASATQARIGLPRKSTLLSALQAANVAQREAESEQLALVAAMGEVWSVTDSSCWDSAEEVPPNVLFGERLVMLGAEGTPEVAEFLALEIGCALEISPDAARALLVDVLNLRHRLPITWEKALSGDTRVWVARRIAQETTQLTLEQARKLDADLGPRLNGMTPSAVLREVTRLVQMYDPAAEDRQARALGQRSISLRPDSTKGVAWVEGSLDPVAARHLDATLNRGAEVLALGGQEGGADVLRSITLGVLAHPARAYRLIDEGLPLETTEAQTEGGLGSAPQRGVASSEVTSSSPSDRIGTVCQHGAELIIRVGRDEVGHEAGGVLEAFGPITKSYLKEVLAGCGKVTVRPIIDLAEPLTVASYQPSPRVAWAVKERDRREMFPFSNRSAHGRGIDCDHTVNYDGSNTSSHNLGPFTRRTHRAKTHGGYRVEQSEPGVFHWVTPAGQELWTTARGTWRASPPDLCANEPGATTRTVLGVVLKALARQDDQRKEREAEEARARERVREVEEAELRAKRQAWEHRAQCELPSLPEPPNLAEPPNLDSGGIRQGQVRGDADPPPF